MKIHSNNNINNKGVTFNVGAQVNHTRTNGFTSRRRPTNILPSHEDNIHYISGVLGGGRTYKPINEIYGSFNKTGVSAEALALYESQIQGVLNSVNGSSSKPVVSFDIETIGSVIPNQFNFEAPLPSEKDAFSILEIAADKNTWVDGKRQTSIIHNIAFGIDEHTEKAANEIIKKFMNNDALTSSEMSTVNTLAKIGATSKNYGGTLPLDANGNASYIPASIYDKNDIGLMKDGVRALRELGTNPDGSSSTYKVKGSTGRNQLTGALKTIEAYSNQGWVISQNGLGFDIPVLEAVAREQGIPFNVNSANHVDKYKIISDVGYDMTKIYDPSLGVTQGHGKLETQARIPEFIEGFINSNEDYKKYKNLSHTGIFDTGITTASFDTPLATIGNKTVMEDVLELVKTQRANTVKLNANRPVFKAVNSLPLMDLSGKERNSNRDFGTLDHITESYDFYSDNKKVHRAEQIKERKQSLFRSNNFYEMQGVEVYTTEEFLNTFIGFDKVEDLSFSRKKEYESIKKVIEKNGDTGNIYVGRFKNLTSHNDETSYLIRNSYESLMESMNSSLQASNLSQDVIEKERTSLRAREMEKKVNSYTDPSDATKGTSSLYDDMARHGQVVGSKNKGGMIGHNIDPTRENLLELIKKGYIKNNAGKTVTREEALGRVAGMFNKKTVDSIAGTRRVITNFNSSLATDILDSFEWMSFNKEYYKAVKKSIDTLEKQGKKDISHQQRTIAQAEIDDYVSALLNDNGVYINNAKDIESFISRTNMLNVDIGLEEPIRLNMASNKTLETAISNAMSKDVPKDMSKSKTNRRKILQGKEIASKLQEQGVISKSDLKEINKLTKPYEFTNVLRDRIQKGMAIKTGNLSERDLSNPLKALNHYESKLSKIGSMPKISREEKAKLYNETKGKIKALNFLKANTGVGDEVELAFKSAMSLIDENTGEVLLNSKGSPLSIHEYLSDMGAYKDIDEKFVKRINSVGANSIITSINTGDVGDAGKVELVKRFLSGDGVLSGDKGLGYSAEEADEFVRAIFGKKGMLDSQSTGGGLGVTFFTKTDNAKNLTTAHMLLAPSTHGEKVLNSIKSNTYMNSPHMAIINIPSITENSVRYQGHKTKGGTNIAPIRLLKQGGNTRIIEENLEFYYRTGSISSTTSSADIGNRINARVNNSVMDYIKALRYAGGENIAEALVGGQGNWMTSKIGAKTNEVLSALKTPSIRNSMFRRLDGTYVAMSLFNTADFSSSRSRSIDGLVDLLPFLYNTSSERDSAVNPKYKSIRTHMKNLFEIQRKNNPDLMDADSFFKEWQSSLLDKREESKYGKKYGLKGLAKKGYGFVAEDFVLNFNTGLPGDPSEVNYLAQIRDSSFYSAMLGNLGEEKATVIEKELSLMQSSFSRNVAEIDVSRGKGSLSPVFQNEFGGDIQSGSRPMNHQMGNYIIQDISHLEDYQMKDIIKSGIMPSSIIDKREVNKGFADKEFWGFVGIDDSVDVKDLRLMEKFTTDFRMINEKGLKEREKLIREKLAKKDSEAKRIEDALWDALFGEKERSKKDVAKNKKFDDLLEFVINDFSNRTTFEQRVVLSPMASALLDREVRGFMKTDDVEKLLVKTGDILRQGDPIGLDSRGNRVNYTGRGVEVLGMHEGKVMYKELNPVNRDRKLGSGAEKGTAGVSLYDSWEETKFAQVLFNEMYGENVNVLANYNLKGHKSPSFAYERINNFALEGVRSGSSEVEEFVARKLRGLYVQNGDVPSEAEVIKRFSGTSFEGTTTFRTGANSDILDPVNAIEAYQSVKDSIDNDAKLAYDKAMAGSDELTQVEDFLSGYYKNNILTHDKDVYTVSSGLLPLEEHLGGSSSEFRLDEDALSNKGAKVGFREMFFMGKHSGTSKEAQQMYYDMKNGKIIKSMGEVIVNNSLMQMERTPEFQSKARDLRRLRDSVKLMIGDGVNLETATPEEITAYEERLGFKGRVKALDVEDIVMNSPDMSPEHLRETIFGIGEMDDVDLIRINLSNSNISLNNPVAQGNTGYIYLANLENEYIHKDGGKKIFSPTEAQKAQIKLLNSIKGIDEELVGTKDFIDDANKASTKVYREALNTINDKDSGIVIGSMYKQKIPFSGVTQFGDMLEHNFDSNLEHSNKFFNKNLKVKVPNGNGDMIDALQDIVWMTEDEFTTRLGKRGIEDIGYDLVHKSDYDSNRRLKDTLVSKGILDKNYSPTRALGADLYDEIGRVFLETEGLPGVITRPPVFNADGQVATSFRLKNSSNTAVDTRSATMHFITAKKLNADSDGDLGLMYFLGRVGEDGRFEMPKKGSELRDSHNRMILGQAIDNNNKWNIKAYEQTIKSEVENFRITDGIFYDDMMKETNNTGNILNGTSAKKYIKQKYDKVSIGPVSNANFYNNQLADVKYMSKNTIANFDAFHLVTSFGSFTEQSIISAKKDGSEFSDEVIANTQKYSRAMRKFTEDSPTEGVISLARVLKDGGSLDLDDYMNFYEEKGGLATLYKGNLNQRINYINEYLDNRKLSYDSPTSIQLKGLAALKDMYDDPMVQSLAKDPLLKHTALKTGNLREQATMIVKEKYSKDTFGGKLKHRALNIDTESLDLANNSQGSRQGALNASMATFLDSEGLEHYVSEDTYIGNGRGKDTELLFRSYNSESGEMTTHSLKGRNAFLDTDNAITTEMYNSGMIRVNDVDLSNLDDVSKKAYYNANEVLNTLERNGATTEELLIEGRNYFHEALIKRANGKIDTSSFVEKLSGQVFATTFSSQGLAENDPHKVLGLIDEFDSIDILNPGDALKRDFKVSTPTSKVIPDVSIGDDITDTLSYKPLNLVDLKRQTLEVVSANMPSLDELSGATEITRIKAANRVITSIGDKARSQNVIGAEQFKSNLISMYSERGAEIDAFMGWNADPVSLVKGLDSEMGHIKSINTLGEARVYTGSFTNQKLKDMTFAQIDTALSEIENSLHNSKDIERAIASKNIDAITMYREHVLSIASMQEETHANVFKDATIGENIKYTDSIDNISNYDVPKEIKKAHKDIIDKAMLKKARMADSLSDGMARASSISGTGAFMIGTGIAVAGSLIAGSLGMANKLDPDSKNSITPMGGQEEGVVIRKNSPGKRPMFGNRMPTMERRSSTMNMKTSTGATSSNIVNALRVNYGSDMIRVNVNNEDYGDNNSDWFEREMANQLS